jgi:hypothetical protein
MPFLDRRHSQQVRVIVDERRRELLQLDPAQPDYESCRRSLEQAIDELVSLWQAVEKNSERIQPENGRV